MKKVKVILFGTLSCIVFLHVTASSVLAIVPQCKLVEVPPGQVITHRNIFTDETICKRNLPVQPTSATGTQPGAPQDPSLELTRPNPPDPEVIVPVIITSDTLGRDCSPSFKHGQIQCADIKNSVYCEDGVKQPPVFCGQPAYGERTCINGTGCVGQNSANASTETAPLKNTSPNIFTQIQQTIDTGVNAVSRAITTIAQLGESQPLPIADSVGEQPEVFSHVDGSKCMCAFEFQPGRTRSYVCENQSLCCGNTNFTRPPVNKAFCETGKTAPNLPDNITIIPGARLQTDVEWTTVNRDINKKGCGPTTIWNICTESGRECDMEQIVESTKLNSEGTKLVPIMDTINELGMHAECTFSKNGKCLPINKSFNELDTATAEVDAKGNFLVSNEEPEVSIQDVLEATTAAGNVIIAVVEVTTVNSDGTRNVIDHVTSLYCSNGVCKGRDTYFNQNCTVNTSGIVYEINFSQMACDVKISSFVTVDPS